MNDAFEREDEEMTPEGEGLRGRGEQALGDLANALLDNAAFNAALSAAFGARERAVEAQNAAMDALNLPSASEQERLQRRLRSMSDRLEGVEEQLDRIGRDVSALRRQLSGQVEVAPDQAKLEVDE